MNRNGAEKKGGNGVIPLGTVCPADDKTLQQSVDTAYQPRKLVFTVEKLSDLSDCSRRYPPPFPPPLCLNVWCCSVELNLVFLSSQERIGHLTEDLNDERSSADRLMERLDKAKEQARSVSSRCSPVMQQFINILAVLRRPFVSNTTARPYICFHCKHVES